MRLFLLILAAMGAVLGAPAHLKPGALTAPLGTVTLVEDALFIRYSYSSLLSLPAALSGVTRNLAFALTQVENELGKQIDKPSFRHAHTILRLLRARLTSLTDKLDTTVYDYGKHPVHARTKRGLLNIFGKLSQSLFGTAMDEDVQDLRHHYQHLINVVAANRRVINLHSQHIATLFAHVKDLLGHTNTLRTLLNSALVRLHSLEDFFLLDQSLDILETSVDTVLSRNSLLIQNLVDASKGRVTSSLLPVADLLSTLKLGKDAYNLQPFFNEDSIEHYYPSLESVLTVDAVVIYIPFQSSARFLAYEITPFPFSVNRSVLLLDLPATMVLIAEDFSVFTTASKKSLDHCVAPSLRHYHCDATMFAFRPIVGNVCEVVLTRATTVDALLACPYKHIVPESIFHCSFHGYHYFFFPVTVPLAVVCPNGTTYVQVVGHYAIHYFCHITAPNITTYPKRLYQAFTANMSSPRIFALTVLQNLTFSNFKYVTNTLHELTFSNHSEFTDVLEESLPEYLNPVVFYPSLLGPILIAICILIPLFICVYKALRLYNSLRPARVARDRLQASQ